MKDLIDYTKILRSKNAGPLFITFDLIFKTKKDMKYVYKNLKKEFKDTFIVWSGFCVSNCPCDKLPHIYH